ncbi:hypothetical protein R83H12_00537 [Fibrobacteria bacterium R8-3-H12]
MKKSIAISLSILLTCTISFAAPVGKEHFYGEWTDGDTLTFIYNISANSLKVEIIDYTSLGIPFKGSNDLLKWEYAKNPNKTLNANFPDGYLIKTKRGDGTPTYFYLWRHYKNPNIIMRQVEEIFLEGRYEIFKKSIPFKQTDFYGEWNLDGVSVGDGILNVSAKNIKFSSFENGEPIEFNFPILRWEAIKNPDEASVAFFPDGYMINTESAGGYPKTLFLWRKSKSNDIILFQPLDGENSLLFVRAKRKGG